MKKIVSLMLLISIMPGVLCGCNSGTGDEAGTYGTEATIVSSEPEVSYITEPATESSGTTGSAEAETSVTGLKDDDYETEIYEHGDIDGNGQIEYAKTLYKDLAGSGSTCEYYFNNKLIYTVSDADLTIFSMSSEYLDLDGDGEKEIFIHYDPAVNSMPGVDFAVLDYSESSGWSAMNNYLLESFGCLKTFPIKTSYIASDDTILISCDGYGETYTCDMLKHYDGKESPEMEETYYKLKASSPDEIGGIMSWGIWEVETDEYGGEPCLVATQGVYGTDPRWDNVCELRIYFDYSGKNGDNKMTIKHIDYQFQ